MSSLDVSSTRNQPPVTSSRNQPPPNINPNIPILPNEIWASIAEHRGRNDHRENNEILTELEQERNRTLEELDYIAPYLHNQRRYGSRARAYHEVTNDEALDILNERLITGNIMMNNMQQRMRNQAYVYNYMRRINGLHG